MKAQSITEVVSTVVIPPDITVLNTLSITTGAVFCILKKASRAQLRSLLVQERGRLAVRKTVIGCLEVLATKAIAKSRTRNRAIPPAPRSTITLDYRY